MKFLLIPCGTHGNIRPMLVLSLALINKGHEVISCSSPEHEEFFKEYGITFYPMGMNFKDRIAKHPEIASGNDFTSAKAQMQYFREDIPNQFNSVLKAARGVDCIIGGGVSFAGRSIAEYYKIPYRHVLYAPGLLKSYNIAPYNSNDKEVSGFSARLSWAISDLTYYLALGGTINKCRRELGLPPVKSIMDYYTNDAIVVADEELGKVNPGAVIRYIQTGFWHLKEEGELDKELEHFLEAGPKPVFIGFGSMSDRDPEGTKKIINNVVGNKGIRFIISKGLANLLGNSLGENVKVIDYVPHSKLFPRMAAIAHHGGAGTVHTAALAGVPQIIVPHLPDHPYWGVRIHKLQLGPKPIMRSKLTSQSLLEAISEILGDLSFMDNANKMGQLLNKKNTVSEDIDKVIEWIKSDLKK